MAIGSIDVVTLKQWLAKGDAVLVDVREPDEWNAGHIEGAIHLPLGQVSAPRIPAADGRKLVIYCRSGRRSLTACDIVTKQNPERDAYNLEGGILAWDASCVK